MIDTGLFVAEVWENDSHTQLLSLGIIQYFHSNNRKVYYKKDNPFTLLNIDSQQVAYEFESNYSLDIKSSDYQRYRTAYATRYLADELKTKPVTAPICFTHNNGKYYVTKGNKKLVAMAIAKKFIHPIIVVSDTVLDDIEINTDEELFVLLKNIDTSASKFYVRIEDLGNGIGFHYLTKYDQELEWVLPLRLKT